MTSSSASSADEGDVLGRGGVEQQLLSCKSDMQRGGEA